MSLDSTTKDFDDTLDLKNDNKKFQIIEDKPPKTEAAKNLPIIYSLSNDLIKIRNTKFVLLPESEQIMTVKFSAA